MSYRHWIIVSLFFLPSLVTAYVASSDNFRLQFDSINFGGGLSSSENYTQESTFGEISTGRSLFGSDSVLNAGYQQTDATSSDDEEAETCQDASANNFGGALPCTYGGGGGGPGPVDGCTDPLAENYNNAATRDDGSCIYPVPNVLAFSATPSSNPKLIKLDWINPPNSTHFTFSQVRIMRRTDIFPLSPNDGTLIYQGSLETVNDLAVEFDTVYYYTIFVQAADGRFSSGVVDSAEISTEEDPEEDPDPFDRLPDAPPGDVPPGVRGLQFLIRQIREIDKIFTDGSRVAVNPTKDITFWVDEERVPAVLKIIGATIFYPGDESKTFSFLLRVNSNKTAYEATIGKLAPGRYPTTLYLINYQDQSLTRLDGTIVVPGNFQEIIAGSLKPLITGAGFAAGLLLMTTARSLSDLILVLVRAFNTLIGFLTGRRRRASWGTVYDAVTKQPIDPAIVRVLRNGKEVSMAITDLDGRYGFLLPTGAYQLIAGKTHYQFPSQRLLGRSADELYDNLYFGETITTDKDHPVIRNIPLDPIGFDWNEFIKNRADYFRLYSKRERVRRQVLDGIFWGGFIFSVMLSIYLPSTINFSITGIYVLIWLCQRFLAWRRPIVTVKNSLTGDPVPFALVRFFMADLGYEAKAVVTDELGRFYALLRPGNYYYTVEEKQADGSYLKIYQSKPEYLKRGLKEGNIEV